MKTIKKNNSFSKSPFGGFKGLFLFLLLLIATSCATLSMNNEQRTMNNGEQPLVYYTGQNEPIAATVFNADEAVKIDGVHYKSPTTPERGEITNEQ
jgi:hypothetical protein